MTPEEMVALRKQAESTVSDMPEGELKVKAFEVAYTHLLSTPVTKASKQKLGRPVTPADNPTTPTARIITLREEEFFVQPRSIGEVQEALKAHGWHYGVVRIGTPLLRLVQQKHLRRDRVVEHGKKIWKYVNQ